MGDTHGAYLRLTESAAAIASVSPADIGTSYGWNYKAVKEEDCDGDSE